MLSIKNFKKVCFVKIHFSLFIINSFYSFIEIKIKFKTKSELILSFKDSLNS